MDEVRLLDAETADDVGDEDRFVEGVTAKSNHGILQFPSYRFVRLVFVVFAQFLYFVLGAGYYCFPMWLNQIIPNHVAISLQDQSLMGGMTYASLGLCGTLIIYFKTLKLEKTRELIVLSLCGSINVSVTWFILTWLVWSTSSSYHEVWQVWLSMVLLGLGIGVFYMVFLGEVLKLIHPSWHFLYLGVSSVMFSAGSIVGLSLKLSMSGKDWMMMVCFFNILAVWLAFFAVLFCHSFLLATDEEMASIAPPPHTEEGTHITTPQLLKDLAFGERHFTSYQLLTNGVCDLSSTQFRLLITSFTFMCSVGTAFMANLGVLTSSNDTTEDNHRAEVIVLIWAASGQTLGRILVPLYTFHVKRHYDHLFGDVSLLSSRQIAAKQSITNNRTVLVITQTICALFCASLIALRFLPSVSFIVATTFMSVGYGSMWSISSSFPVFFPSFDFTLLLCFQQVLGAVGTVSFVLFISLCKLNNAGTFLALLVASLAALLFSSLSLVSRVRTEPTEKYFVALN